ncbi:NADPH-dependent FMN reductase, partial [Actinomyces bouchesdurhonensis]|uniref:NADPH-dependent FMN reductase n=1 Tax=Actinomyces bouchesdurhonensis TaxID=1852361 RepID=UPI003AEF5DC7
MVVLGSIRPGRVGEQVVRWIEEQSLQVEGVNLVFIDLRDYNLPLFAEQVPPSMQAPTLP